VAGACDCDSWGLCFAALRVDETSDLHLLPLQITNRSNFFYKELYILSLIKIIKNIKINIK
jgi:hypothetical protein